MGAKPVFGLVSREGIEPSTRGLKVPCSATELPALFRRILADGRCYSRHPARRVNEGATESEITSTIDTSSAVPSAPASATRDTLTTVEKNTGAMVTSKNTAA